MKPEKRDPLLSASPRALVARIHELEEVNATKRAARVLRARKSREAIAGLEREVSRLRGELHRRQDVSKHSEERRLELLALAQSLGCDCVPHKMLEAVKALQVAAHAEGNECIRVRLPRVGGPQVSLDGVTWHDQKTGRKV